MKRFEFLKIPVSILRAFDPEAYFQYIWISVFMTVGHHPTVFLQNLNSFAIDYLVCSKVKATECATTYNTIRFSSSLDHS